MTDAAESIAINTPFQSPTDFWSPRLQAIWWLPSPDSDAIYALQNVSGNKVRIEVLPTGEGIEGKSSSVSLSPYEAKLFRLRELLGHEGSDSRHPPQAGGLEFRHDGHPGDVLGRGILVDPIAGFSSPLIMKDPARRAINRLQNPSLAFGPMVNRGFPSWASFHPHLFLFNTSTAPIEVTANVFGAHAGVPVDWTAGTWQVPSRSVIEVDLEELRLGTNGIDAGIAGLNLDHTGLPWDLHAEVISTDSSLTYSFYDPFFDPFASLYNQLTAISFNLKDSSNTLFIAKNTLDSDSLFSLRIHYSVAAGLETYTLPVRTVAPGHVEVVDFKELRDLSIPGENGELLPPDLEFGHAELVLLVPNSFVASDPTYDALAGTCSSCASPQPVSDGGGGSPSCEGTTDCTYYDAICQLVTGPVKPPYYCQVAPEACAFFGSSPWDNCMRLCLQVYDDCLRIPDDSFLVCQASLHAVCAAGCGVDCI